MYIYVFMCMYVHVHTTCRTRPRLRSLTAHMIILYILHRMSPKTKVLSIGGGNEGKQTPVVTVQYMASTCGPAHACVHIIPLGKQTLSQNVHFCRKSSTLLSFVYMHASVPRGIGLKPEKYSTATRTKTRVADVSKSKLLLQVYYLSVKLND